LRNIFYRLKKDEKGQSLVEFAFVIIPLVLLLLGIIEFSWLFNGQMIITGAAREGARASVIGEDAEEAVNKYISASAVIVKDVLIIPGNQGEEKWKEVTVNGEMEPLVGFFLHDTINLTAKSKMRQE